MRTAVVTLLLLWLVSPAEAAEVLITARVAAHVAEVIPAGWHFGCTVYNLTDVSGTTGAGLMTMTGNADSADDSIVHEALDVWLNAEVQGRSGGRVAIEQVDVNITVHTAFLPPSHTSASLRINLEE